MNYSKSKWSEHEENLWIMVYSTCDLDYLLEAVRIDGLRLKYMHCPGREVEIEAIKQNFKAYRYVVEPAEELAELVKESYMKEREGERRII